MSMMEHEIHKYLFDSLESEFIPNITKVYENHFEVFKVIRVSEHINHKFESDVVINIQVNFKTKFDESSFLLFLREPIFVNSKINWKELEKINFLSVGDHGHNFVFEHRNVEPVLIEHTYIKLKKLGIDSNNSNEITTLVRKMKEWYNTIKVDFLNKLITSDQFSSINNVMCKYIYDYVSSKAFEERVNRYKISVIEEKVKGLVRESIGFNMSIDDVNNIMNTEWVKSIHEE